MANEDSLWKGSSSQWLNLGPFVVGAILSAAMLVGGLLMPLVFIGLPLPLGYLAWRYLVVRTQVFELTNQRLRITRGVINQTIDEIELYRIKDTQMIRPWWMRITGLGSILMETSDRGMPTFVIPAIPGGSELRETLRRQIELERDRKRVRELDFDDVAG
jgi:uncharacterized membrane protein YdbT with pleckstrin-like domain